MEKIVQYFNDEAFLFFIFRVILGILFFFQGYDKVVRVKMEGVVSTFQYELGTIKIPEWVLILTAYFSSYIELIGGALLIVGLFKSYTMYLLGVNLILVTAAFSLIKPMWDMQFLFPRLILLGILLYLPDNWDMISLDYVFNIK